MADSWFGFNVSMTLAFMDSWMARLLPCSHRFYGPYKLPFPKGTHPLWHSSVASFYGTFLSSWLFLLVLWLNSALTRKIQFNLAGKWPTARNEIKITLIPAPYWTTGGSILVWKTFFPKTLSYDCPNNPQVKKQTMENKSEALTVG